MKVLVTGGYGFIGSHVAERFYKEGYEIFIIDNLSTGSSKNVTCKHKAYKINVENKKCDEIFRNNRFDVVIHLAAQVNPTASVESPFVDTKSNVLGLVNMLELSAKYKVKKFIFSSSSEVYGSNGNTSIKEEEQANPISPYGMSKHLGEQYCVKWNELYKLETVCFRISNVYGPRQSFIGEGGVISILMDRLLKNQELIVYGTGNQTRDFIYVADVAEAIYRSAESYITGIYNLSTNIGISVNELVGVFKLLHPVKAVANKEARKGDILNSCLDNSKVKKALDWVPMFDLNEGLRLTYNWYIEGNSEVLEKTKDKEQSGASKIIKMAIPYLENILMFFLIVFITRLLKSNSSLRTIDLNLIYIILISITYGTKQSIISIVLSCGLLISSSLEFGHDLVSMLLDTSFILNIGVYFLIGMVISYAIDKRERQIESNKTTIDAMYEDYNFLHELYNETYTVKLELQNQIVNSEDSFGKIYGVVKELDNLEPQHILQSAVGVLEGILKTDEISIYTIDKTMCYLRLAVKSNKSDFEVRKTINFNDLHEAKETLLNRSIFVNKALKPEIPMLMSPIMDKDAIIGVIMIHNVEFERLNLFYKNLFKVVADLITASLIKAYKFENAILEERFLEDTIILKYEFFNAILEIKIKSKQESNSYFSILAVTSKIEDYKELSSNIKACIRDTDFVGLGSKDTVNIILSNSNSEDALLVLDRLRKKGVKAEILAGDDFYA